jgi:signal transduction histidine kinase
VFERAIASGKPHEKRYVHKDGSDVWVKDTVSIISDQDKPQNLISIAVDITELKRTEEMLREADRRKDEFLATLTHELRNPLALLRNALEILRVREGDRRSVSRIRETTEHQGDHLARLVDDLLEVSCITRGQFELRKERVAQKEIIENAVETSRPLIDTAGHKLAVKIPHWPVHVDPDPVPLSQVITNLLSNAVKYTKGVGHIKLSAVREQQEVVVRMRDTGIGIAENALSRIFNLFAQADTSSTRGQGSLGSASPWSSAWSNYTTTQSKPIIQGLGRQ